MVVDAQRPLFDLFGLEPHHIEKVLATALDGCGNKGAFADIYLQSGQSIMLGMTDGEVTTNKEERFRGAGVRVLLGERTGHFSTDDVTLKGLCRAASIARAVAEYAGDLSVAETLERCRQFARDKRDRGLNLYPATITPSRVKLSSLLALLNAIDARARLSDARIMQVSAGVALSEQHIIIAHSLGKIVYDRRPLVRLNVQCMAREGDRNEVGSAGGGGRYELSRIADVATYGLLVDRAAADAVEALSATPAPVGEMSVVLGNGWPGVLFHEAVGHGLEADFNRKKTSAFSGLVGQRVASELCTIIDDGTIAERRGSLVVDDEGVPTSRTVLIENGILKGYLHDRQNAMLMGVAPTGNGRRESFQSQPMPRMTNTFLEGGNSDPEEIIRSVKFGIYADSFAGGSVDITNGKFVFAASHARIIRDGKLGQHIKGATLIGDGPTALLNISMVGNDMKLDLGVGTCSKNGQDVPVGVGMPTIRIDNMTVGGTGETEE